MRHFGTLVCASLLACLLSHPAWGQAATHDLIVFDDAVTGSGDRFNTAGTFQALHIADSAAAGVPLACAYGPRGFLYVTSSNNGANVGVLRYNGTTGASLGFFAQNAALTDPRGLVFGSDGNLYVSDGASNSVLRFNARTGAFVSTFVAAGSGGLSQPAGLVFARDGSLLVVSGGNDRVKRYDGTTGAYVDDFIQTDLDQPWDIRVGPVDKDFYVSNRGNSSVVRFNRTTGSLRSVVVSAGSGGLSGARSMVFGPDDKLYVGSANNGAVRRYDGTTGAFEAIHATIVNGALSCGALTFALRRDVVATSENAAAAANQNRGFKADEVSGAVTGFSSTTATNNPIGACFGIEGHFYVASQLSDTIVRHRGDGTFVSTFVTAGLGGLDDPLDVDLGRDGNLYVLSRLTNDVKRYDGVTGASLGAFATGITAGGGRGMVFGGPNADLFVSDGGGRIFRFNGSTGALVSNDFTGGNLNSPWGMAFSPLDSNLYVADRGVGSIRRFNATTGAFISDFVTGIGAGNITHLVFGADDNLYVADQTNGVVRRYNGTTGASLGTFATIDRASTADLLGPRTAVGGAPITKTDLNVTLSVDESGPLEGGTINYTLTIQNAGPNSATNVSVTALLPSGVTYVSDTPSQGTYVSGTGVWTVGTINNGATATLQVRATVNAGQAGSAITFRSSGLVLDQTESNTNNSVGSVTINVAIADLAVTKTVDDATPRRGQRVIYTLTVRNNGPLDATNVRVSDVLPTGLGFAAATPSQGSFEASTGKWTVGSLANGSSATLRLEATISADASNGSTITNTTSALGADQPDTISSNDTGSVGVTIQGGVGGGFPLPGANRVVRTTTQSDCAIGRDEGSLPLGLILLGWILLGLRVGPGGPARVRALA